MAEAFKKSASKGIGECSYKDNPMSKPRKGSELPMRNRFGNADRSEVDKLQKSQMKNESLRGMGG